ncbi:MAG: entericidin A/B family lipoprotein [Gammaproteobacteria bacterium]|nr:entericidin A/B family lipoprotein [Gammaproteobacteria bacterium]
MKFKTTAIIFGLFSFLLLAGCENTIQGFGKDMQHAGQKIENSTDNGKK